MSFSLSSLSLSGIRRLAECSNSSNSAALANNSMVSNVIIIIIIIIISLGVWDCQRWRQERFQKELAQRIQLHQQEQEQQQLQQIQQQLQHGDEMPGASKQGTGGMGMDAETAYRAQPVSVTVSDHVEQQPDGSFVEVITKEALYPDGSKQITIRREQL